MAILLNNDGTWHDEWLAALSKYMPSQTVQTYPNISHPDAIEYACVWKHPDGDLRNYPNLKAVFSLGSGVDHLDGNERLPDVPIFRLIDMNMADDMALYTLYWVIHFQRQMERYRAQQSTHQWERYPTPLAPDFTVCLLGLGAIGSHIAQRLAANGFKVYGWSRSAKVVDGVDCVSGDDGLKKALSQTDVMVSCLPLTADTRHSVNSDMLGHLKPGGFVMNISRGGVVDDADLLACLDSGHVAGAALDVFGQEPLPETSPYWSHPNVHVTPHMSGATNPDTAAQIISKELRGFENGIMPPYPYKREAYT